MAIRNLFPDGGCIDNGGIERTHIRPISSQLADQYSTQQLCLIAAVGHNGALGVDGDMIWHLHEDLKRFKMLTLGHPVIMGRKTWESLPRRPLPGRKNIVISRNERLVSQGAIVVNSLSASITAALPDNEIFIIGGGQIYALAIPFASRLFLTRIDADAPHADTFFPEIDPDQWMAVEYSDWHVTEQGLRYRYENYVRI